MHKRLPRETRKMRKQRLIASKPTYELMDKLGLMNIWDMDYLDDKEGWLTEPIKDDGQALMPPKIERRNTFFKDRLEATPSPKAKTLNVAETVVKKSRIPKVDRSLLNETFSSTLSHDSLNKSFIDDSIQAPLSGLNTTKNRKSIFFTIGASPFKPSVASTPMPGTSGDPNAVMQPMARREPQVVSTESPLQPNRTFTSLHGGTSSEQAKCQEPKPIKKRVIPLTKSRLPTIAKK